MTKAHSLDQIRRRKMVMRELGRRMRLPSEGAAWSPRDRLRRPHPST
jgi:hypothetical protein